MYCHSGLAIALAIGISQANAQSATPVIGTGPFGLPMGASLAQLRRVGPVESLAGATASYILKTVPKPHEAFESYLLIVLDGYGLCKISAIGKTIQSSSQGYEIQSAFRTLETALRAKYGNRKHFDFLTVGSIWNDPEDWMMGLLKKERTLTSYWDDEEGSTFTDNIRTITLDSVGESTGSAYIVLRYEFDNAKRCLEEVAKKRNSSL